jgi:hypothetical protein
MAPAATPIFPGTFSRFLLVLTRPRLGTNLTNILAFYGLFDFGSAIGESFVVLVHSSSHIIGVRLCDYIQEAITFGMFH